MCGQKCHNEYVVYVDTMRTNWPQLLVIHRISPGIHRFIIVGGGGINAIAQSSDVPAAALFSMKMYVFHLNKELQKRRRLYQHQAAFPKPVALETGSDTARFSFNTAPTVYQGSASPWQPLANSVPAPSACSQRETGNRWAVRADSSPSSRKTR